MFLESAAPWSLLWIILILTPPGSQSIETSYRLNFIHGVLSSIVAVLCLLGYIPEAWTTSCTISYFVIDFFNNLINDFYFKAPTYHTPVARKMEYFHHILCFTVGIMSEYLYPQFCTFTSNPFVELMFAEFSTPMLMIWRYTKKDYPYLYIFIVLFIIVRLGYHGFFFIPQCITKCHYSVGWGFGLPYNLMNLFFTYTMIHKIMRIQKKAKHVE